jgi:short-subunit dehydrogenase
MDPSAPPPDRPLAVVTGASSGIGYELARLFAEHGFDLVVAAEDDAIATSARELEKLGAWVRNVQVDLATPDGVRHLSAEVERTGRPVDALALNAGIGAGGEVVGGTDLDDELRVVDLNCRSTVHLAKLLLPGMVARDRGRVLVTSSIASMMPGSFQAVSNASKSFVQSFAEALQEELQDSQVTVTSLIPGPTEVRFFERAGMQDTRAGASEKDDAADVARQGFEAMMAGEAKLVAGGAKTTLQGVASKVVPDRLKAKMHRRMAEPHPGGD